MGRLKTIGIVALVALLLPVLLLWVAVYLFGLFIWSAVLRIWFWRAHAVRGRRVLFVYSESPNWQAYVEETILPRIRDHAVVLNWSECRLWSSVSPWEARFFRLFAGDREFNPLALVFCARGRIRNVRFHQAFLEFNHGKESALRAAEAEFFSLMEGPSKLR